ncbi:hypothetical protein ACTFIU_011118 [Dictyostelium citrinum]
MNINKFILVFFIAFFLLSSCLASPTQWKKTKFKSNEKSERVDSQIKQMKLIVDSNEFKNGNYNSSSIKFSNQIQLFENDKILAFFLDQVRDYFSEIGFDPIAFENYIKSLCNTLLICRIPILGDAINLTVDIVGILLEAQCYRDRVLNTPLIGGSTTSQKKSPVLAQRQELPLNLLQVDNIYNPSKKFSNDINNLNELK